MKQTVRKTVSLLLALVLLLGLTPALRLPAAAANVTINSSNFPDANFRTFVKQYDTSGDNTLSSAELAAVTSMDCHSKSIANLKGIEHFTALKTLNCSYNSLTTLDVSALKPLTELYCARNQLTSLNVTGNPSLKWLSCNSNKLTALNVGNNTVLERLICNANQISTLNVKNNTKLIQLTCTGNKLGSLDVSANTKLKELDCGANSLSSLDLSTNTALTALSVKGSAGLTRLDVSAAAGLEILNCQSCNLTKLTLGSNDVLGELLCQYNSKLRMIDISQVKNIRTAVRKGSMTDLNAYVRYKKGEFYLECDEDLSFDAHYVYPLFICGVQVDEYNQADVLDDGVFTFDGGRLLTVNGSCQSNHIVIDNRGVKGLRIRTAKTSVLESSNSNTILARVDTSVTGPARLIVKNTYDHGGGIHAYGSNVTLRLEEADLRIEAYYAINGSYWDAGSSWLNVNHSSVQTVCGTGAAVYGFTGGIELRDVRIMSPSGAKVRSDGFCIVDATGDAAADLTIAAAVRSNPFTDLPADKYYYNPALWAYNRSPQIASGATTSTFGPGKDCKREQIMTFLWKAAGAPEPKSTSCPFADVPKNKYYYKPILWAVENGITGGVSTTKFGVGKACTREQVVTFLWKWADEPDPLSDRNPFSDVSAQKYYYKAVLWAAENKIASGTSSTSFGVGKTCTRGQVVTFLYKLLAG